MSQHLNNRNDEDYALWLRELKERYRRAQIKAATRVNEELIKFYWSLGRDIVARDVDNKYGKGFYATLSSDLRRELPDVSGLSEKNLYYTKRFFIFYNRMAQNRPQVADNFENIDYQHISNNQIFSIPWGHHRLILDRFFEKNDVNAALFYIRKTVQEGWSRNILKSVLDTNLHLREGKAISSFSRLLPAADSELAQELTRDPYVFDFTGMTKPFKERELKDALINNLSRFLIELGSGFAYVGKEYRLQVGNTEQFIDLLFYNVRLHCYCVIEVKTGSFGPGDIGQLGTYMTAVNHILKSDGDNPTIGMLICKDKDNILVQYALEASSQPIGVSEFQLTKFIPDELRSSLPSIEDIESELK